MSASKEIWILGATGRVGRATAAQLLARQMPLALVGRDGARLREMAASLGGEPRIVVAGSLEAASAEIARSAPAVVINTIGPFAQTALPIARACPRGSHYVDLANELDAIIGVLESHDEAVAAGRCLVTGAGFGLLATESIVLKLCEGRPPAARVRVDAVPRIDDDGGPIGEALAATIVESLVAGGRRYREGQLVRAGVGSDPERLTLPDGSTVVTGAVPTGDLEAARRASRAPSVVAASNAAPSSAMTRVLLPVFAALLSWRVLRNAAKRRLARARVALPPNQRQFSFTHARVEWPDGTVREGWLRASEGMVFTASVTAEVAIRLANDSARPGAYTPGALFGPDLAVKAGGQFLLDRGAD